MTMRMKKHRKLKIIENKISRIVQKLPASIASDVLDYASRIGVKYHSDSIKDLYNRSRSLKELKI